MAIRHKYESLTLALKRSGQTELQVAAHAPAAPNTVKKVLAGSTNVHMDTLGRIAHQLGLEVEINYRPIRKEAA